MSPGLEALEPRCLLDAHGLAIQAFQPPAWLSSEPALTQGLTVQLFLQQFGLSLPGLPHLATGLDHAFLLDVTQAQYAGIVDVYPETTLRLVLPFGGGWLPVIVAPAGVPGIDYGVDWEEACISKGWWFQDPPGVTDHAAIPPGPQTGLSLNAPNLLTVDAELAAGWPAAVVFA